MCSQVVVLRLLRVWLRVRRQWRKRIAIGVSHPNYVNNLGSPGRVSVFQFKHNELHPLCLSVHEYRGSQVKEFLLR